MYMCCSSDVETKVNDRWVEKLEAVADDGELQYH